MSEKPDCFECKHRGKVPGSAHSRCNHPSAITDDNPLLGVFAILASTRRIPPVIVGGHELNVKGDSYGIEQGWFNWPFDFDPTWLLNCDGFDSKTEGEELKDV